MHIAFYAPMNPPTDARPSGDRRMARLLMTALRAGGHEVTLASTLRAWDGSGDRRRQARLRALGARLADRLVRRYRATAPARRPHCWVTYHPYYKAPDWIGPAVADALAIPYVVAEASHAPRRATGPWALGHAAAAAAIARADAIIVLNPADEPALRSLIADPARLVRLRPFLDAAPAPGDRAAARRTLAARHGLDPTAPWLLAVAMMRAGDKRASYESLARALGRLGSRDWRLVIVGDGAARAAIEAAFAAALAEPRRAVFAGRQEEDRLSVFYAACDLFVWPAINEAYGMALLEAQAAGLPAVAGDSGGVGTILRQGETGLLVAPGDDKAFAGAVGTLLDDAPRRAAMGRAARRVTLAEHGLAAAARTLDGVLAMVGCAA